MKKGLIFTAVLLLAFATVLVGCSSAPIVYDKSVSLEESSTIMLNMDSVIHEFDGKKVLLGSGIMATQVIIPAGEHTFSATFKNSNYNVSVKDTQVVFLAGHSYFLYATMGGSAGILDATELLKAELEPDPSNPDAFPFEGKWINIKNKGDQLVFVGNQFFTLVNGKYSLRGFFSYEGNEIRMPYQAVYSSGKWGVSYYGIVNNIIPKATYNGTTIVMGNREFKKVE